MTFRSIALAALIAAIAPSAHAAKKPAWRSLPVVKPAGEKVDTGSYIVPVEKLDSVGFKKPAFSYNADAAVGRKSAKVVVLIYNPVMDDKGTKFVDYYKLNDPVQYSHILAEAIRETSWGYINYDIVDIVEVNGFPTRLDGTKYTVGTYEEARRTQKWHPSSSTYRGFFEDNNLLERFKKENISELWVWGASGFGIDEYAMYIPNRYARFAPTDNPWFYRPYDIPEEIGHTTWVMGFNVEVGSDNMIHSYAHRIEGIMALAMGDGRWDTNGRRDPWNVFSFLETDHPGTPSQVGNCHVPPNGQSGYDYNNKRPVQAASDNWARYPDIRGDARKVTSEEWCFNQYGYMRWLLAHVPKFEGSTEHGYNNWWVYIANTDEDLPAYRMQDLTKFRLPAGYPPPTKTPQP